MLCHFLLSCSLHSCSYFPLVYILHRGEGRWLFPGSPRVALCVKSRPNLYQYCLIFYHSKSNWPLILSCTYRWWMRKEYQEMVNLWNLMLCGMLATYWLWGTTHQSRWCCISTRRAKGDKVIIVNAKTEEDMIPFPQVIHFKMWFAKGIQTLTQTEKMLSL